MMMTVLKTALSFLLMIAAVLIFLKLKQIGLTY